MQYDLKAKCHVMVVMRNEVQKLGLFHILGKLLIGWCDVRGRAEGHMASVLSEGG